MVILNGASVSCPVAFHVLFGFAEIFYPKTPQNQILIILKLITMQKQFTFGKIAYNGGKKTNLVEVEITLKTDKQNRPVFTSSAHVWNSRKTDIEMGGQCLDSIYEEFKNDLQNLPLYEKILGLWERNHLNDTNAGTPEQTAFIEGFETTGWKYDYTQACEILKEANLYEVPHPETGGPYKYGHGWIYREISENDLKEINELFAD